MKKIRIITFHSAHNYGAMLQVYALQEVLKENNDVKVINYRNPDIDNNYKIINLNKSNLKTLVRSMISNMLHLYQNVKRYNAFNKFMNNKLNLTETYKSEEELKNNYPKADVYITGSDQVWNTNLTKGIKDSYTLNFGEPNIKRISYAASIGNSQIEENEIELYKEKISKIDKISVREQSGKKILSKIIDNPIEEVLDPTLLITQHDWNEKVKDIKNEKEKYILAYVVEEDEEYFKILNELSNNTGLKVIHFDRKNKKIHNVLRSAYSQGPLEFINLIKNAEYVICTSFHATVFSIIFNKKFFVIPHRKTGTRVTNLLDKLGISNRAVCSLEEFKKKNYKEDIDYEKVNKILELQRQDSMNWLNNAIDD